MMQLLAGNLPSSSLNHLALCNLINDQEQETWIKHARALGSRGASKARGQELSLAAGTHTRTRGRLERGIPAPYRLHVHAAHIAIGSLDGCLLSLVGDVPAAARECPGQGSIFHTQSQQLLQQQQSWAMVQTQSKGKLSYQPRLQRAREGTGTSDERTQLTCPICQSFPEHFLTEQTQTPV